jgi:hypothetical protein
LEYTLIATRGGGIVASSATIRPPQGPGFLFVAKVPKNPRPILIRTTTLPVRARLLMYPQWPEVRHRSKNKVFQWLQNNKYNGLYRWYFLFAAGSNTPPFRAVRIGNTNKKMVVDPIVNNFLAERTS